jgi:hypothetical protein
MDPIDESLLAELRAALTPGADADARRAGADACRTLLAVLDPPTASTVPALPPPPTSTPPPPTAAPVPSPPPSHRPPPSQVMDMLIAHLRAKLPADHEPRSPAGGFRVAMIPMRRSGRGS